MVDKNQCVVYTPVIMNNSRFQTIHITLENGRATSIRYEQNILAALKKLGMDLTPHRLRQHNGHLVPAARTVAQRRQFFRHGPGKSDRLRQQTSTPSEEMNRHGFEVLPAKDILRNKIDPDAYDKFVVTMQGSELSRGGGGCRCMTQPIRRQAVAW